MLGHQISLIDLPYNVIHRELEKRDKTFFSIAYTQFSGLEYTYEVLMGPFSIKILVLNLQRQSHNDDDMETRKQEIGAGSFGTVSLVKVRGK